MIREPGSLTTGGTLTASDVDNGASWSWDFVPQVNDYGTFGINASTGVWSYTLANNALVDNVTDEFGAFTKLSP
ncbi:VCBS domain-containing protein [Shewanella sp. Choline-02u-19]|uniref:VCBS domain-containing protein n=1 Tax=Shewanella sp. Choline-02u-19 TaxID=2058309 RepID=UPI0012FEE299|nr:VCBS domain-containing protein [Shewanella sp. Choline-02u-19]